MPPLGWSYLCKTIRKKPQIWFLKGNSYDWKSKKKAARKFFFIPRHKITHKWYLILVSGWRFIALERHTISQSVFDAGIVY